jgi:arylsulfatase A-like enzyme
LAERAYDFSEVTPEMTRATIARYYGMVEMIDRAVGRLLESVERAGSMDDTVFVFAADHGELLGDYGLWRKGSYHYDCLIRAPAFVAAPGRLAGGRRTDGLVEDIDLTATVLGLAGLGVPFGMQGRDLSASLAAGDEIGREWTYTELYNANWGPFVACWTLRTPTAKLNYYPADRVGHLFDLVEDPDETSDLYASPSHRPVRDEMTGNLVEEIRRQTDPLSRVLSQY